MRTISIADLKARLCAELKKVQGGESLEVLDHKRPVARIIPLPDGIEYYQRRISRYEYEPLDPIIESDPLDYLDEERGLD